jgi:alkylphosphonate utilization operon protein PhnA
MKAGLDQSGLPIAYAHQFIFKHHPPEAADIPYSIPNQLIQYSSPASHVPWGNWRSVDHSTHGFLTESFIDEMAHAAKQDPFAYRKNLIKDQPRFQRVLDLVYEKSNWEAPLPPNWGRGIAIAQSFGSIVAEVAEVEVGLIVKDANGTVLSNGDSVVIAKDLPVKGAPKSIKAGTKVKNIRLVEGDHNIDCKIDGFGSMALKSEFVRKA